MKTKTNRPGTSRTILMCAAALALLFIAVGCGASESSVGDEKNKTEETIDESRPSVSELQAGLIQSMKSDGAEADEWTELIKCISIGVHKEKGLPNEVLRKYVKGEDPTVGEPNKEKYDKLFDEIAADCFGFNEKDGETPTTVTNGTVPPTVTTTTTIELNNRSAKVFESDSVIPRSDRKEFEAGVRKIYDWKIEELPVENSQAKPEEYINCITQVWYDNLPNYVIRIIASGGDPWWGEDWSDDYSEFFNDKELTALTDEDVWDLTKIIEETTHKKADICWDVFLIGPDVFGNPDGFYSQVDEFYSQVDEQALKGDD